MTAVWIIAAVLFVVAGTFGAMVVCIGGRCNSEEDEHIADALRLRSVQ